MLRIVIFLIHCPIHIGYNCTFDIVIHIIMDIKRRSSATNNIRLKAYMRGDSLPDAVTKPISEVFMPLHDNEQEIMKRTMTLISQLTTTTIILG